MTTERKNGSTRMTAAQVREENAKLKAENERLRAENEAMKDHSRCFYCGKLKRRSDFYVSTDPNNRTGHTPICKECVNKIAFREDPNGEKHSPTRDSVCLALEFMNKPFLEKLWDSSVQESENQASGRKKSTPWTAYIKNIQMQNYDGMTWKHSDLFKEKFFYDDELTVKQKVERGSSTDTYENYINNKADVVRLLGYDPFEKEPLSDQPLLYSQLLGMLDSSEDANDDMVRTASAISIVRGFSQSAKLDDTITKLMSDAKNLERNSATIKSLQQSKKDVTGMIKDLAAESCLSLKNSKNAKKGENTWTGKMKKLKDLNIREQEINGFDIGTCRGMQQVANISMAAIWDKLKADESEMAEMIAEQRKLVANALQQKDAYAEAVRILLRENIDLRNFLAENNLLDDSNLVDLDDVVNTYISEEGDKQ